MLDLCWGPLRLYFWSFSWCRAAHTGDKEDGLKYYCLLLKKLFVIVIHLEKCVVMGNSAAFYVYKQRTLVVFESSSINRYTKFTTACSLLIRWNRTEGLLLASLV